MRVAARLASLAVVLAVVAAGVAAVPQPAAAADNWPNTCLDSETLSTGTHFGTFGRGDRDVVTLDLAQDEYATLTVKFNDVGSPSKLVLFGLNRFIMRMDDLNEKRYFQVDESQFPKHYYNHTPDMNFSLSGGTEREYRERAAGKELFARHFARAHRFSNGEKGFRIDPAVDKPICLVLTDAGSRGSGSWTITYEKHSTASTTATPQPSVSERSQPALRETITAKNERIDSLISTVSRKNAEIARLQNQSGGGNGSVRTVVKTVQKTKVVERTQIVYRSGGSNSSSSAQTPGFTTFSAVVALFALLFLVRRR